MFCLSFISLLCSSVYELWSAMTAVIGKTAVAVWLVLMRFVWKLGCKDQQLAGAEDLVVNLCCRILCCSC